MTTELLPDQPCTDPNDDLFGYAPFAENLAKSICCYQGKDGLVLAIYGPWGSGKSTMLNFVEHFLRPRHENSKVIVIHFNPWWFSGQDKLARAFFGQLQAILSPLGKKFKKIAECLGDLAESTGGLIGKFLSKLLKRPPKDVSVLKKIICDLLNNIEKHILVIVDDIDRLTPEETHQVFTVIKALADFPNVIYLLAFDHTATAQSISKYLNIDGERYLEKIIQVPFELPTIDRVMLHDRLFKRLNEIMGDRPEELFDQSYWDDIFSAGLAPMFRVPRDVIRLTNTMSVTYPVVQGEVNPVDFIALEAIRVFLPKLYDIIRMHPERFSGKKEGALHGEGFQSIQDFQKQWLAVVPEPLQKNAKALVERLFPRAGHAQDAQALTEWRRNLRACHPEIFPVYFRLTVPSETVSRQEVAALISSSDSAADFGNALVHAGKTILPQGYSKARILLDRLTDHVETDISEGNIAPVIQAFFEVGDTLFEDRDDPKQVGRDISALMRSLLTKLLPRLQSDQRVAVLEAGIEKGKAIAFQGMILDGLGKQAKKADESNTTAMLTIDAVTNLKKIWLNRLVTLSDEPDFVTHKRLAQILAFWREWGDGAEIQAWCKQATASDQGLFAFLKGFVYCIHSNTSNGAFSQQSRINLSSVGQYLDITECAGRLQTMHDNNAIPDDAHEVVTIYLNEFDMLQSGSPTE